MQRCLQLALLGAGNTAPNPMVGAVLVFNDNIFGEGYHMQYGKAHAEVNCINSVAARDRSLIEKSSLYVSLEPCVHFGKTPPCTDLIISMKIPEVVIGCRDSYEEVNGRGISKLESAGVKLITGVLEEKSKQLNKRFFTFHRQSRPYIILKWAQSLDNKIAGADLSRIAISNEFTNRLVHKWRSEEAAIIIGTNTALSDDPALTNRLWTGNNPVRVVVDKQLSIPAVYQLLSDKNLTIIFNNKKEAVDENITYAAIDPDQPLLKQVLQRLHQLRLQSVLVEGGTKLLQSFIDQQLWDEARVITNEHLIIGEGMAAPVLSGQLLTGTESNTRDKINYYRPLFNKEI